MTQIDLELELSALRTRRAPMALPAWMRRLRPFDRRAIREPGERDAYWAILQQRLAESDAAFIIGSRSTEPAAPTTLLIG